jgi:ribokinase
MFIPATGDAGRVCVRNTHCGHADATTATHVPPHPVEPVDTTAAGDSFCGALADALARGRGLGDAVRWATRAAAITVTRPGAQPALPTRAELEGVSLS